MKECFRTRNLRDLSGTRFIVLSIPLIKDCYFPARPWKNQPVDEHSSIWLFLVWCLKKVDFYAARNRIEITFRDTDSPVKCEPGWGQNMDQGSMDHLFGPGPWTTFMDRVHGQFFFFYFYKKVLHQVYGHSKKDLTRRCWLMLVIDHKYLVVLTWHKHGLHMCSRKTVKLS